MLFRSCLGENLDQRNANQHLETVKQQLKESVFQLAPVDFSKVILAYEPIWAIGTGQTATPKEAQEMHMFIRNKISELKNKTTADQISILYGGSCSPKNENELFACPDIDGGLIGGASLNADDFLKICNSI